MNDRMQLPGWTNAWTMPIKTRIDMLSTGVRTPIGIKVFGTDLNEIEKVGTRLEHLISPILGTRSVLYERNLGGLYVDITPRPDALARYGLRVGDIQDVIESAIGGTPIGMTVEGRNRFSINVRYPQDLRNDIDKLRRVLVPIPMAAAAATDAPEAPWAPRVPSGHLPGAPGFSSPRPCPWTGPPAPARAARPGSGRCCPTRRTTRSDAPLDLSSGMRTGGMPSAGGGMPVPTPLLPATAPSSGRPQQNFIPLGQLADIRITGGPPMVRSEAGLLVGYVYVDIDQSRRDIGGYVDEAKAVVNAAVAEGDLELPQGNYLKWTGQYEQLEQMVKRMKVVVPLTLGIVVLLLFFQFRSFPEVLIVLLSIPFALVGSIWMLYLLDYRLSTAVWVGIIALVGLAAQTGIVMIVYIDNAFDRRKKAGQINNLDDIIAAHMEGTVQRVRPKLMTVATMLIGLIPLLWATTSGADVMKRIAAPMVGGLITSAFLTLEIIPSIVTYWRYEQLLWEKLAGIDPDLLVALKRWRSLIAAGGALLTATLLSPLYLVLPAGLFEIAAGLGLTLFLARHRLLLSAAVTSATAGVAGHGFGVEAPGQQGATTSNTRRISRRSNAAGRDASAAKPWPRFCREALGLLLFLRVLTLGAR